MSVKLIVFGRRQKKAAQAVVELDKLADAMERAGDWIVRRCDRPADLVDLVALVARAHGKIDRLDLCDHGMPGHIVMGEEVLFSSDDDPKSPLLRETIVLELREHLTDTAQVRLLGCRTVARSDKTFKAYYAPPPATSGRLLLLKIAIKLGGHRIVFGTLDTLTPDSFSVAGFGLKRGVESSVLFSSLGAIDVEQPTTGQREDNITAAFPPFGT